MTVLDLGEKKSGVVSFEDLANIIRDMKQKQKSVVHCHGVFDLLHLGHIRHLKRAKKYGDVLVVTITPDIFVNKGPSRPAFSAPLRAEALEALEFVDYVSINKWSNAVNTITCLKPDFYVKGSDYQEASLDKTGGILLEKQAVESVGGKLVFTDEVTFSSSRLINEHMSPFSREVKNFLKSFSKRYSYEDIGASIDSVKDLKVLLVGETILDDYHYCKTLGKSSKDPVLAACYDKRECYVGGVLAVANHVANFCDEVTVVSFLGCEESHESFIRSKMKENVKLHFFPMALSKSTIVKRRYVEKYPFQKLFEVYTMDNDEEQIKDSEVLCRCLKELLPKSDLVVVTDYGHGMCSTEAIELLSREAKFLSVNTQLNAGNQGYNTISKYPNPDFVCISENELRFDLRSKRRPLKELVIEFSRKRNIDKIVITRGERGLLTYDARSGIQEIPAFTGKTIDRVGAGDSVLAISSLLVYRDIDMEVVGLIGNAVGFHSIQTVGNKASVDKLSILRSLEHALK